MPSDGDSGRQGSLSRENQANLDGLSFSDLDESLRQRLDVPLGLQGAVIVRVTPDSKGAQAGLRPGDVILQINNTPIKDAAAASRAYRATKGTKLLQLLRRGAKQFVAVK
jgi:serine protease Do